MVWIKSWATAAWYSFYSGSRSCGTKLAAALSCIKISDTAVFGIPRSASSSSTVSCPLQPVHVQHSQMFCLLQNFQNVDHFNRYLTIFEVLVPHFFFCAALIALFLKAFWIIWIVSAEECLNLMQNLMQIHYSTHSVILNAMATQYIWSLNGVYHPHWLVQWGCHCSHMHIPVHSPWPPGYIDFMQSVLIMLTMAGFFLHQPHCI